MKILCFIDSLGSGGAQRQLVELAKGFKEKGHEVLFLTYHEINFFKHELDAVHIPVKTVVEPNYLKRTFKIRKAIRKEKPDAVLSFLEGANFMATLAGFPSRKWKLVVGERSANPNILRSFKLRMYRWFHLFADYVVANSNSNLKIVRKINPLLPNKKCKVIYNMVDNNKWSVDDSNQNFQNEKFNIVIFASHQYLKNAKGMIEAIHLLSDDVKAKIIIDWYGGKSPDNSYNETIALTEQYNLHHIINFYDSTDLVKDIMISSNAVGLFSYYEGLPNVVCEAMMLGRPVIASNVSDVPNFLQENLIFNPSDSNDIAKVIHYLITLNRVQLMNIGNQNLNVAKELFEKNKIISSYTNLFKL